MLKDITERDSNGRRRVACSVCNRKWNTHRPHNEIHHACNAPRPQNKVEWWMLGTIIARVLARFGVKKTAGCRCDEREAALNRLGLSTLTNLSRAYHATRGLTIF